MYKHRFRLIGALTALVLATGVAQAQEMTFAGQTNGSFSNANSSLGFSGSTFDAVTAGGVLEFGSASNNFGVFTMSDDAGNFGGTFDLLIAFASPTGIQGGQSQSFEALVSATLNPAGNGLVAIDFDNSPITRMFNGSASGSFALSLNDVAFRIAGNSAIDPIRLSGRIIAVPSGHEVPEPEALALLGAGFALLLISGAHAGDLRRKR